MKRRKIRLKYKKERVLFSDVLPYELPVIFSNRYFYRFLVSNGIALEGNILKWKSGISKDALAVLYFIFSPYLPPDIDLSAINNNSIIIYKDNKKPPQISIPFLYKIRHKPNKLRRLALIHPVNQIEVISFYEKYKSLMLYSCSRNRYSLRHPESVASYFYYKDRLHHKLLGKKKDNVELFFNEYENLKTYFCYKEYSNIYRFYEDYRYQNAEKRFAYLHKFDIQSCFDSIYTHSIAWALCGGKNEYKKHFSKRGVSFGDEWDNLMQRMNYNETNGIVIGPEFSRIFAEVILQYIDSRVEQTLKSAGFFWKKDYECYRYVDDIFFYYNNEEVKDLALREYETLFYEFKLSISREKSENFTRPFITPISIAKVKIDNLLNKWMIVHPSSSSVQLDGVNEEGEKDKTLNEDLGDLLIKEEKIIEALNDKDYIFINSKDFNREFKSIMIECKVESKDIMNYTLAVIASLTERLFKKFDMKFYVLCRAIDQDIKKEACKKKKNTQERMLLNYIIGLLDVIFFLYSSCKRVNTTLKMMTILNDIIIYVGSNYTLNGETIKRFSSEMRDEVYRKIQNEIELVFKVTQFDVDAQIETLYFLIILRSIPHQYSISPQVLRRYFSEDFDFSKLNAIAIIILLYFCRNINIFEDEKRRLLKGINKKFENSDLSKLGIDAELMILALDLLACPFITNNDRKNLCVKMGIDSKIQSRIERYFRRHKYMFTKWSEVDLTKELGAKVSQEVYT